MPVPDSLRPSELEQQKPLLRCLQITQHATQSAMAMQACAVDPGGVATGIWRHSKMLMLAPVQFMLGTVYAPASDAAKGIVHAATAPLSSASVSGEAKLHGVQLLRVLKPMYS